MQKVRLGAPKGKGKGCEPEDSQPFHFQIFTFPRFRSPSAGRLTAIRDA